MKKPKSTTLEVQGTAITVLSGKDDDYICLTDIAKHKEPDRSDHVIQNWMRNRDTVEFLGVWERLNNPDFKPLEFEGFRIRAGLNSFVLTPRQWIERTGAIGITFRAGRYGGTFAHRDIAFDVCRVDFRRVQALPHQRTPAAQGGREPPPLARMEPQPHPLETQLPHPHRRGESAFARRCLLNNSVPSP